MLENNRIKEKFFIHGAQLIDNQNELIESRIINFCSFTQMEILQTQPPGHPDAVGILQISICLDVGVQLSRKHSIVNQFPEVLPDDFQIKIPNRCRKPEVLGSLIDCEIAFH